MYFIGWVFLINSLLKSEGWKDNEGNPVPCLRDQVKNGSIRAKDYIAFHRAIIRANEQAKRVIDINDTISADTILRLQPESISMIYKSTDKSSLYDIVGNFEYMLSRISNRDLYQHGYDGFNYNDAPEVIATLIVDLDDFDLIENLFGYVAALKELLLELGESPKLNVENLFSETTFEHQVNSVTGVPDMDVRDPDGKRIFSIEAVKPFLNVYAYQHSGQVLKAVRDAKYGKPGWEKLMDTILHRNS